MTYGQGKDIQANYQSASKHGSGLNGLILGVGKIIEGGVNLGFGAQQGNPQKAMQGATTISQGFGTIGNEISSEVQVQRQGLNLNMNGQPIVNPMIQQYNNNQSIVNNPLQNQNNQQIQNQQNAQIVAGGFDMNAGFNPRSGMFHDGSGNTVSLEKQATFQQLTPQQTQMINSRQLVSPMLANNQNQKVMNYLNYINL